MTGTGPRDSQTRRAITKGRAELADRSTIDPDELAKFGALAGGWWDPEGDFRPLHRLNPTRLAFIRDSAGAHFARDIAAARPLAGLEVLDIGCGGGLLSEPLARLGARVTGYALAPPTEPNNFTTCGVRDLLVDHDEGQPVEGDALLEQGVGADHQVDLAAREVAPDRHGLGPRHRGGEQREAQTGRRTRRLRQALERARVLLGQQLRGCHEGDLKAGFDGLQRPCRGHHGLARANVALNQSLHRV